MYECVHVFLLVYACRQIVKQKDREVAIDIDIDK